MSPLVKSLCLLFFFLLPEGLAQELKDVETAPQKKSVRQIKIKNVSDLQALTPYESVAVIQKRYLPKTFRGEFSFSMATVINHTFSYFGGVSTKAGFFLREDHGFGLEFFGPFFPFAKPVKNEMISEQSVIPYTISTPQFYGGAYYKWSPVFGKFSILNKRIVYFDMYLTLGGGVGRFVEDVTEDYVKGLLQKGKKFHSDLKLLKSYFPAGSVSVGQVFALSQDWAVQWELKWLYAMIQYEKSGKMQTGVPVNIGFSLGVNYYFPGAGYR